MVSTHRKNDPYAKLEEAINTNNFDMFLSVVGCYTGTPKELEADYVLDNGDTLIARAVKLKCKSITRYLIEVGADMSLKDADGNSAVKLLFKNLFGRDKYKQRETVLREIIGEDD